MKHMSIWQWIRLHLYMWAEQYPDKCGKCGMKVKGNIFIGYRFGCKCKEIWRNNINVGI